MERISTQLTVYFEDPFWVGIFEKFENEKLSVAKVTFGAEPKDYEVYAFVLKYLNKVKYSPAIEPEIKKEIKNPKRLQRELRKQMKDTGIGTKSQQALKLQQEQYKTDRKVKSRERKLEEKERYFALKQQKKKEKHRGH